MATYFERKEVYNTDDFTLFTTQRQNVHNNGDLPPLPYRGETYISPGPFGVSGNSAYRACCVGVSRLPEADFWIKNTDRLFHFFIHRKQDACCGSNRICTDLLGQNAYFFFFFLIGLCLKNPGLYKHIPYIRTRLSFLVVMLMLPAERCPHSANSVFVVSENTAKLKPVSK